MFHSYLLPHQQLIVQQETAYPLLHNEKGPPGLHQRPLNMGQRSDVPLPEVAFMPMSALLTKVGQ
jgi:hypothetical protein